MKEIDTNSYTRVESVDEITCPGLKEAALKASVPDSVSLFISKACAVCALRNLDEEDVIVEYDPDDWKPPVIWVRNNTSCKAKQP